jgi:hypothetical protein
LEDLVAVTEDVRLEHPLIFAFIQLRISFLTWKTGSIVNPFELLATLLLKRGVGARLGKHYAYLFGFDFEELRASLGDNLTTLPLRQTYTGTDVFVDRFRNRDFESNFGTLFDGQPKDIL